MLVNIGWIVMLGVMGAGEDLPDLTVKADDTVIAKSCRIVIPPGIVIEDKNDDGVIQITASDIVVEFADGSILQGAKKGTRPDEYQGYGIRLNGQSGVAIRKAKVHGYRCGVWASRADGLTVQDVDASDSRRAHLRSTPMAEDESDWLSPHDNDKRQWLNEYGAAMYIDNSARVTVRRCRVRDSQNGLCLDRVTESKIYDNDLSFLSGWGMALWRCSKNVISRNAVDFCIRGYSHGVYNRGQDSAGFLVFEQCSENVLAENSATHGGDGLFGFAGREALGEAPVPTPDFNYKRRGDNDNLLIDNDFSYAAAHGIEMTFSFGNRFIANRLVGNAICGVWGGYSQETLIAGNVIEENGEGAYGLERGGVNIEHGSKNRILHNKFARNKCAVHLWWDEDASIAKLPWAKANGTDSIDNLIAANVFDHDDLVFQFRGHGDVTIGPNTVIAVGRENETEADYKVIRPKDMQVEPFEAPEHPVYGETRPVGARKDLQGRQNIIMTEWGPWDHQSPLIRLVESTASSQTYEMRGMPGEPHMALVGSGVAGQMIPGKEGAASRYVVTAKEPGVYPYTLEVTAGHYRNSLKGVLMGATWNVTFFNWTKDVDPRENLDGWRQLARGEKAVSVKTSQLMFRFGMGGPSSLKLSPDLTGAKIGPDYFGMIAETRLPLPKGKWKFTTLSDDGVRVKVKGKPVIDDWCWHPPKRDEAVYEASSDQTIEIVVEYFEIDGYAVLEFNLTPES
ncbi:MAG TPA: right-handed parallel beta-helix repeat-containing protein [Phycisphaerae bacterium]|nr:right-handed parallel beta-helix repeat-containing protein [Phycisphaerae bacterium]